MTPEAARQLERAGRLHERCQVEEKLKDAIALASQGRLDADELSTFDGLRDLSPVILETARRLPTRITMARFLKALVPSSSLSEISQFIEEVIEAPPATAHDWRAQLVVTVPAQLQDMARWEPDWFREQLQDLESPWFVFEPRYDSWLLRGRGGSLFKIVHVDQKRESAHQPSLVCYPLPAEPYRIVKNAEWCEYLGRWVVSSNCRYFHSAEAPSDAAAVVEALQQGGALLDGEVSRFFLRCCEQVAAEIERCTGHLVPGYQGPAEWYRALCSEA